MSAMTTPEKIDIDHDIPGDIKRGLVLFLDADQLNYRRATSYCFAAKQFTGKHYFVCIGTGLRKESYWIPLTSLRNLQGRHVDFLWKWGCEILGLGKGSLHAAKSSMVGA